jgi:hypothetical protein
VKAGGKQEMVSCLAYSLTLKMVATCSSETLVGFPRTTWHYIPEGRTLSSSFVLLMMLALKVSLYLVHCSKKKKRTFSGYHWSKENHKILPVAVMNQDYTITSEI